MSAFNKKQQYFLLDSCVVEYLLDRDIHDVLLKQLGEWCNKIFEMAISEVVYSELINGAKPEKETRVISLLNGFYSLPISKRIIKGSGILGSLYKEESPKFKDISLGDRIIAMTSAVHNTPIITANISDFPSPFFHTITYKNLIFKKTGKDRMISVAVLETNYPYITNKFNNRN